MKKWISDNAVFLSALLSAIIVSLQQALSNSVIDWKAIGWALIVVVLGTIGNQWKGKGLSLSGIVGTVAYNFVTIWQTGTFTWSQFILTTVIALLMLITATLQPQSTTTGN
jgi:hypothetical protein